ncbi:MAG: DUF1192 domain-containing protein [Alphaproteobacteria bacterium]|nr:MAG: DUF1192 domain-containing protein [Alphaproteobacteria bacterium]
MDLNDLPKNRDTPIEAIEAEKLDTLSLNELAYRIKVLKREIVRIEAEIKAKSASISAAEDVFKK